MIKGMLAISIYIVFGAWLGASLFGAPIILPCLDKDGIYVGVCAIADKDAKEGDYVTIKRWGK